MWTIETGDARFDSLTIEHNGILADTACERSSSTS